MPNEQGLRALGRLVDEGGDRPGRLEVVATAAGAGDGTGGSNGR